MPSCSAWRTSPIPDFDVVVADDGSGPDTAAVVEAWKASPSPDARPPGDDGYRLASVRNLGAQAATGDCSCS